MNPGIKSNLEYLINKISSKILRDNFSQEPAYTSAYYGNLHESKILDQSTGLEIDIQCSISDDRGPNSAEKRTGIDIGLIVKINDTNTGTITNKAIFLQAKNNPLSGKSKHELLEQCSKMRNYTEHYAVVSCPSDTSNPIVYLPSSNPPFWDRNSSMSLVDYIADEIMPCNAGDQNSQIIEVANRSDRLINLTINGPIPKQKKKMTRRI